MELVVRGLVELGVLLGFSAELRGLDECESTLLGLLVHKALAEGESICDVAFALLIGCLGNVGAEHVGCTTHCVEGAADYGSCGVDGIKDSTESEASSRHEDTPVVEPKVAHQRRRSGVRV